MNQKGTSYNGSFSHLKSDKDFQFGNIFEDGNELAIHESSKKTYKTWGAIKCLICVLIFYLVMAFFMSWTPFS